MDVSTAQLYDLLVEKGFDRVKVRAALAEIVTRDELDARIERGFDKVRAELYRAMMVQSVAIIGTLTAIIALFF